MLKSHTLRCPQVRLYVVWGWLFWGMVGREPVKNLNCLIHRVVLLCWDCGQRSRRAICPTSRITSCLDGEERGIFIFPSCQFLWLPGRAGVAWKEFEFCFSLDMQICVAEYWWWACLGVVEWEVGFTHHFVLSLIEWEGRQPGGSERVPRSHVAAILRSDRFSKTLTSLESLILRVSPNSAQYLVNTDESLWNMLILFFHFYTISRTFPFEIQYSFRFCSEAVFFLTFYFYCNIFCRPDITRWTGTFQYPLLPPSLPKFSRATHTSAEFRLAACLGTGLWFLKC